MINQQILQLGHDFTYAMACARGQTDENAAKILDAALTRMTSVADKMGDFAIDGGVALVFQNCANVLRSSQVCPRIVPEIEEAAAWYEADVCVLAAG